MLKRVIAGLAGLVAAASAGSIQAQPRPAAPQNLARSFLQTVEVPGSRYQAVMGTSALGPDGQGTLQTHPGPEVGYVLEGGGTMLVSGRPPLSLAKGQSYSIAPGVAHQLRAGPGGVTLLITWVVEAGKPFETVVD